MIELTHNIWINPDLVEAIEMWMKQEVWVLTVIMLSGEEHRVTFATREKAREFVEELV